MLWGKTSSAETRPYKKKKTTKNLYFINYSTLNIPVPHRDMVN